MSQSDLSNMFRLQPDPRLSDLVDDVILIACTKCGLGWQEDRHTAIVQTGNIRVRELVWRAAGSCRRKGSVEDPCGATLI